MCANVHIQNLVRGKGDRYYTMTFINHVQNSLFVKDGLHRSSNDSHISIESKEVAACKRESHCSYMKCLKQIMYITQVAVCLQNNFQNYNLQNTNSYNLSLPRIFCNMSFVKLLRLLQQLHSNNMQRNLTTTF